MKVSIGWLFLTNHVSRDSNLILDFPEGDGCADQSYLKYHSIFVQPLAAVLSDWHSLAPHFLLHSLAIISSWCRALLLVDFMQKKLITCTLYTSTQKPKTWGFLKYLCTQGCWNILCGLVQSVKYEPWGTVLLPYW